MQGLAVDRLSFSLIAGWNQIGSISETIHTSEIEQNPPNSIYYQVLTRDENDSYQYVSTVEPGMGYWVYAWNDCQIVLQKDPGLSKKGQLDVTRRELPDHIKLPPLTKLPQVVSNNDVHSSNETLPEQFLLRQNYPNPFNPETRISFDLPHRAEVQIRIYNIAGQAVKTFVLGDLAAGTYTTTWNGLDDFGYPIPSGVYVYSIQAGEFTANRRMLLIR